MGGFLFVIVALAVIGVLLLPILLRAEFYFDSQSNKIGCRLSLYGFIKILGGYIAPCKGGFAFHVSDKKALVVAYRQFDQDRKSFAEKHGLRLRTVKTVLETDIEFLFPIYAIRHCIKGALLFFKDAPKVENAVICTANENIRLFVRADFSTSLIKELYFILKSMLLGGNNETWQKKKSVT